jgi:eukaryotic-like serine/threonine-protein kinase
VTPERWRQIEVIFDVAVELGGAERDAYVARACGDDATLRLELEGLLAADRADKPLRDVPGRAADTLLGGGAPAPDHGRVLGPYRLVGLLGEGGMGAVHLAERVDGQYQNRTAIKILHRGLETAQAVARFRDERQILATLEHPGIVRLLDGGSTDDGLPYLVMEHIEGVPITAYAEAHALSVPARLRLFLDACAAVAYAHQRLVVHRDIKPSNILVTPAGKAKLLDFGIAKLIDEGGKREALTGAGMLLFTPEYSSPEQARGELVSTATDTYSLGAVLYELLAGVPPLRLPASRLEAMRTICEVEPPRPSAVAPEERRRALAGDLDHIVLRALRKEPAHRYASVEQLADDVQRHLAGLPVSARTGTLSYRSGKFLHRHRGALAVAAVVAASLCSATVLSLRAAHRADEQARRARRTSDYLRRLAHAMLFELSDTIRDTAGATAARELMVGRALEYLDGVAAEVGDDRGLSHELAEAYMRIGDIQGSSFEPNLGRVRDGLASYDKARAILERLVASGDDAPDARWSLAHAFFGQGLMLAWDDRDAARASVLEGMRRADALAQLPEAALPVVHWGYITLIDLELDEGRLGSATQLAERCVQRALDWRRRADTSEARYAVGQALELRAEVRIEGADPDGAAVDLVGARVLFEALVAEHPDDGRFARDAILSMSPLSLGQAAIYSWIPDARLPAIADAARATLPLAERLARRDRDDYRAAHSFAKALLRLAVAVADDDPAEARRQLERALAVWESLPAANRALPPEQSTEALLRCLLARCLAELGRRADAEEQARLGLAVADTTCRGDSHQRSACLLDRYHIARMQLALGETASATRALDELVDALVREIALRPYAIENYIGYVESRRLEAELRPDAACRARRAALARWRTWPGGRTPFMARQAARLEEELAACDATR